MPDKQGAETDERIEDKDRERLSIPLDPEEALRALLKVSPADDQVQQNASSESDSE